MGKPVIKLTEELLLSKVQIKAGCWEWQGYVMKNGYGQINTEGRTLLAHRASAHIFNGFDLSSNFFVCHTCDNRKCINPAHLWLGSAKSNTRDMCNKNRNAYGEKHGQSALKEKDIKRIRKIYKTKGYETYKKIADEYGVNGWTIGFIIRGRSWKHVEM